MAEFYTPDEYADHMAISLTTVHRWLKAGKIDGAVKMGKLWRIPKKTTPSKASANVDSSDERLVEGRVAEELAQQEQATEEARLAATNARYARMEKEGLIAKPDELLGREQVILEKEMMLADRADKLDEKGKMLAKLARSKRMIEEQMVEVRRNVPPIRRWCFESLSILFKVEETKGISLGITLPPLEQYLIDWVGTGDGLLPQEVEPEAVDQFEKSETDE